MRYGQLRQIKKFYTPIFYLFLILLFTASCALENNSSKNDITAAGNNETTSHPSSPEFVYMNNILQQEGITKGSQTLYFFDWEDYGIICTDPTCKHMAGDSKTACSALNSGARPLNLSSILHGEKRLIFSFVEETDYSADEITVTATTTIYSCAEDGSNRVKAGEIDGEIGSVTACICDDRLYCSLMKKRVQRNVEQTYDEDGIPGFIVESEYSYSLCCIDLNNFTVTEYATGDHPFIVKAASDKYVYALCPPTSSEVYGSTSYVVRIPRSSGQSEIIHPDEGIIDICSSGNDTYLTVAASNDPEGNSSTTYTLINDKTDEARVIFHGDSSSNVCATGNGYLIQTAFHRTSDPDFDGTVSEISYFSSEGESVSTCSFGKNITLIAPIGTKVIYAMMNETDISCLYCIESADFEKAETEGTFIAPFMQ